MGLYIKEIIIGRPVPYVRMTRSAIWRPEAQNYLGYRNHIADYLRAKYLDLVLDVPDAQLQKKERAKFVKAQKNITYSLSAITYAADDRGDLSNFTKTIEDAIQASGIIFNDKQIKEYKEPFRVELDRQNPRIEFVLTEREKND